MYRPWSPLVMGSLGSRRRSTSMRPGLRQELPAGARSGDPRAIAAEHVVRRFSAKMAYRRSRIQPSTLGRLSPRRVRDKASSDTPSTAASHGRQPGGGIRCPRVLGASARRRRRRRCSTTDRLAERACGPMASSTARPVQMNAPGGEAPHDAPSAPSESKATFDCEGHHAQRRPHRIPNRQVAASIRLRGSDGCSACRGTIGRRIPPSGFGASAAAAQPSGSNGSIRSDHREAE